jgi:hypothetical protein
VHATSVETFSIMILSCKFVISTFICMNYSEIVMLNQRVQILIKSVCLN